MQMMQVFAARPYESWGRLHDKLQPYLEKLGKKADYYQRLIGFVEMQFSQADRETAVPLDAGYLHGYYCMRQTFYQKTQFSREPQEWEEAGDRRLSLIHISTYRRRRTLPSGVLSWECSANNQPDGSGSDLGECRGSDAFSVQPECTDIYR